MQLLGHDYVNDRRVAKHGLSTLAPMIEAARGEALARGDLCLLLDNGDTLQGTPLGDWMAEHGTGVRPHPMAACLNHLGYDAVGLGNHDFDHGLEYLRSVLEQYDMPVVCANLTSRTLPMLLPCAILEREISDRQGGLHPFRVGILSALPPQTADWSRHHLDGRAHVTDALEALRDTLARVRAAGADLVIVLAHMGISGSESGPDPQSAARAVAELDGVDVVIAGHTHLRFPGPDHAGIPMVDSEKGCLGGKPAVLPGVAGSDLGVIDLVLSREAGADGWRVSSCSVQLCPQREDSTPAPEIVRLAEPAHAATREFLAHPVATLKQEMHSYFALARSGPVSALLGEAKRRVVKRAVAGSALGDLPLLVSTSMAATGGLEGPANYVHLPEGRVERRSVAGLSPYHNQIWAVRVTGRQVRDWLERSARIYATLRPDLPDQLLVNPEIPGFRFDDVHGLRYEIDPTRPPAFDNSGRPIPDAEGRIRNLTHDGQPLDPDREFLMATTHYRVGGGGGYEVHDDSRVALRSDTATEGALLECLKSDGCDYLDAPPVWRFSPDLGVRAILQTTPEALDHLSDIADLHPEPLDMTPGGFLRLRLTL